MLPAADRAAAFANLGIVEDTQRITPRITMLKKKGKRVVENADSIMSHLRTRFPAAEFETLEGKDIAVMSLKQQVSLSLLCQHQWATVTQPLGHSCVSAHASAGQP